MAKHEEDPIEVTEENFGALLIAGLEEARAISRGEKEPARRVRRTVTARHAVVDPPPSYGSETIVRIRERMGLSQNVFAQLLNASSETVKAWEQGKREPDGMALALLAVADRHPEALLARVHEKTAGNGARRAVKSTTGAKGRAAARTK